MSLQPSNPEFDKDDQSSEPWSIAPRPSHLSLVPDAVDERIIPRQPITSTPEDQWYETVSPTDQIQQEVIAPKPLTQAAMREAVYIGTVNGIRCHSVPRYPESRYQPGQ